MQIASSVSTGSTTGSVGLPGLEPGTSSLSAKRSNRLSYSPENRIRAYRIRQRLPNHAAAGQLLVNPTSRPPVSRTEKLYSMLAIAPSAVPTTVFTSATTNEKVSTCRNEKLAATEKL